MDVTANSSFYPTFRRTVPSHFYQVVLLFVLFGTKGRTHIARDSGESPPTFRPIFASFCKCNTVKLFIDKFGGKVERKVGPF